MSKAAAPDDDVIDAFLESRGHDTATWEESYNKKQCPQCGGLHEVAATECSVCGWAP